MHREALDATLRRWLVAQACGVWNPTSSAKVAIGDGIAPPPPTLSRFRVHVGLPCDADDKSLVILITPRYEIEMKACTSACSGSVCALEVGGAWLAAGYDLITTHALAALSRNASMYNP